MQRILLFSSFRRDDVLTWLNDSLLPRLLDDSVLLRDTGSVLLGTLRLRQIRDAQGEPVFTFTGLMHMNFCLDFFL